MIDTLTYFVNDKIVEIDRKNQVVDEFRDLVIRYGFKRVTMSDIATAVGISRPALYLLFTDKEEIFRAVVRTENERLLSEIRAGLPSYSTLKDKLRFALEVRWVSTYEMIQALPDANDIHSLVHDFAKETIEQVVADFQALLVEILEPWSENVARAGYTPERIARIFTVSPKALMDVAKDADDLRGLFEDMLSLLIAALGLPNSRPKAGRNSRTVEKKAPRRY